MDCLQIPAVPRGGAGDRRYCTVWKIPDSRDAWKRKKRFRPVSGSPGLHEYRAIKRVPKEEGSRLREAEILKTLRHPGIPVIYDLYESQEYYYIVQEYLEGRSLSAWFRKGAVLLEQRSCGTGVNSAESWFICIRSNQTLFYI